ALEPLAEVTTSKLADQIVDQVSRPYPFAQFTNIPAAQSVTGQTKQAGMIWGSDGSDRPADLDRLLPRPAFLTGPLPPTPVERGTATHAVLEHLNFTDAGDRKAVQKQIDNLLGQRRLTLQQAQCVDIDAILWLMQSPIGQLLRQNHDRLKRELPIY